MAGNSPFNPGRNVGSFTSNADLQHDAVIVLDECLGVSETAILYNRLMMLTSQGRAVTLDCSRVTVVDTTLLQMMASFVRRTNENDSNVVWRNPSAAFCMTTELLGLENIVSLESTTACVSA